MAGKVGDARWFDEEVQSQGRSNNEDQNKTDCSTHAGACGCVCCSCAATIAYGSRHRFDVRRYALAAEKKVYTLEGHEAELAKLAGQKVTVKGILKGDTLSVNEVTAS